VSGDDPNFNLGNDASVAYANVIADGDPNKQTAVWGGYNKDRTTGGVIDTAVRADTGSDYNTGQDVDQILDSGKDSLNWFHLVQARYALTGDKMSDGMPLGSQSQIDDLYFQQKDMKVNLLFGAGQRITSVLSGIQTAHDDQKNATGQLAQYWQGQTGTAAHDKLTELGTWSDDAADEIKALPDIIGHAVDEIKKAVQIKVDAFNKLKDIHRINGVDMANGESKGQGIDTRNGDDDDKGNDHVSLIINYSMRRGIGDNTRKYIQEIADTGVFGPDRSVLPHYANGGSTDSPGEVDAWEFDDKAEALCKVWTQHFIESAKGYFGTYKTLCDETDTAIQGYLKVVVDALNHAGHRNNPPTPNQPVTPSQPSAPSQPSVPSKPSAPSLQSTPSQPGTPSAPTSTTPSSVNTLTSGLSGLGSLAQTAESAVSQVSGLGSTFSSLGQSVTQGLGSLTTQIQQGLDGILGTHNANSNISDTTGKPVAEFDIAGKQMKLEHGKNGALELVLADSDGKGKSYSLKLDEHGIPVITSQDQSTAATSTPDDKQPLPDKKSGDQSPGSHQSTDQVQGSHQSTNQPAGSQQPTPDSGGGSGSNNVPAPVLPPQQTTGGDKPQPPPPPPPQFDSGAELAESGPL